MTFQSKSIFKANNFHRILPNQFSLNAKVGDLGVLITMHMCKDVSPQLRMLVDVNAIKYWNEKPILEYAHGCCFLIKK